jgi:porin
MCGWLTFSSSSLRCWALLLLVLAVSAARADDSHLVDAGDASYVPAMHLGRHEAKLWALNRSADSARPLLPDWHAMKKRLESQHGLSFSFAYSALYQRSSDTFEGNLAGTRELREIYDFLFLGPPVPGLQKDAAGGIAELYGKWTFVRPGTANSGYIGFGLENRHRLGTPINPQALFLDNGSIWPTGTAFGEFDTALLDLYYEQYLHDGRLGFRIGKFLPFGVYDYFSLKNPKASFNDLAFSLTPAIAWSTWGMGVTAYVKPTEQTYINFGIHDTNGGPQRGIETFFTEREYFTVVDAGYNTDFDFGKGNIHAMFWHSDKREKAGTPEARGITVAGEQEFRGIVPFLRYAYQDGQAAALEHFVYGGVGFRDVFGRTDDLIGVGFGWGEPANKDLFVTNQKSLEAFYRVHLSKEFSVTTGLTYIKDPPLNLTEDELTVFSVRGRFEM